MVVAVLATELPITAPTQPHPQVHLVAMAAKQTVVAVVGAQHQAA
jgi:hypothetical protein